MGMSWGSTGAIVGGIAGSYFGPVGTAAGSALGGMIGSQFDEKPKIDNGAFQSQVDPAVENKMKEDYLSGRDRAAEKFAGDQIIRNQASSQSIAASARGIDAGLAQRLAAQTSSAANADTIAKATQLGMQNSNQNLAQYLGSKNADRMAQIDRAKIQAGLDEQKQKSNDAMTGAVIGAAASYAGMQGKSGSTTAGGGNLTLGDNSQQQNIYGGQGSALGNDYSPATGYYDSNNTPKWDASLYKGNSASNNSGYSFGNYYKV